jgi:hypothetical protein
MKLPPAGGNKQSRMHMGDVMRRRGTALANRL